MSFPPIVIHWILCFPSCQDEEELQEALADDYVRAEFLRDRLVPKAVLFFTGEAMEDDEEEEVRLVTIWLHAAANRSCKNQAAKYNELRNHPS